METNKQQKLYRQEEAGSSSANKSIGFANSNVEATTTTKK
jgi:hypothetical protein